MMVRNDAAVQVGLACTGGDIDRGTGEQRMVISKRTAAMVAMIVTIAAAAEGVGSLGWVVPQLITCCRGREGGGHRPGLMVAMTARA